MWMVTNPSICLNSGRFIEIDSQEWLIQVCLCCTTFSCYSSKSTVLYMKAMSQWSTNVITRKWQSKFIYFGYIWKSVLVKVIFSIFWCSKHLNLWMRLCCGLVVLHQVAGGKDLYLHFLIYWMMQIWWVGGPYYLTSSSW